MTTENMSDFAKRLGIHKSNITRGARAGRVIINKNGHVEVEASLKRWHETKGHRPDVAARHAAHRGSEIPIVIQADDRSATAQIYTTRTQSSATSPALTDSEGRTRHKADAMQYENQIIGIEMDLRRGQRYRVEDVKREAHGIGATLRAAMERLIDQTAPRLAVMSDETERKKLLATELRRMQRLIKTDLPRALRRLRQSGAKKGAA